MAKKIWEMMQEDIERNKQASENLQREANEKFNNLVAKKGEYDTSKHTTTIGNLRKAYKSSNSYNSINKSLNRIYLNSENSIWSKIKNIAQYPNNTTNNIVRDNYGNIDRGRTALQMAQQRAEDGKEKAKMLSSAKAYNEMQKEVKKERLKNTVQYRNAKLRNPSASEEELLSLVEKDVNKFSENFYKHLASASGAERTATIKNISRSDSNPLLYDNNKFNQLNNQILEYKVNEEAKEEAEKINKDLQNGKIGSSVGHIASGVPAKAIEAVADPMLSMGSLLNVKTPRGTADQDLQAWKIMSSKYDRKTSNIDNGLVKEASKASGTIGYMVPSVLASIMAPETNIGRISQGISVAGSGYKETINEDASNKLQSAITGASKGITSYTVEGLTGGDILGKGSLDDLVVKTIATKTSNTASKAVATKLYKYGGEVAEEFIENQIGYIVDKVVNDKGITLQEWLDEQGETVKSTCVTNLILNLLGLGGGIENEVKNYNYNEETKYWLKEAEKIIEKENLQLNDKNIEISNKNKEIQSVLTQLQQEENTLNSQQQLTQTQQILPTQQIYSTRKKVAQNGNIEQRNMLPIQNYIYEKSDNVKIDNLRQDASKYWDNSEKTKNYITMLEKIIQDKDIDIRLDVNLTDSKGNVANGSYSNGVITINPNSTRAGEFIAIHELTHAIGTEQMRNIVQKYRESNAEFDTAVKSLLQNYNTTELTEEAMSDVAGQLFGNQEFINNLAQTEPSLFRKIYNEIKYLWHQFTGYKNQDQFINDLQYKWEQAYRNNAKLNETTNYSIAGKKSLENIRDNKMLYNSGISSYDQAQQMANKNISNEQIRKQTGWFQDKNGDWKYEISDKNLKIRNNITLKKNGEYSLNQIIEHDTLFKLYPELENIDIKFKDTKDIGGNYKNKSIILSNDLLGNNKKIEKTLVHEIQHAIQEIEGFETGITSKLSKKVYYENLGEIEADNVSKRFIDEKYNYIDISNIAPESSKSNPKHRNYDKYMKNRNTIDKIKDGVFKYAIKGGNSNDINQEYVEQTNGENIQDSNKEIWNRLENSKESSFSMQDNKGRTLTKQQQEYFKDSKVRNENGNLVTVYHGTNNTGFTEFKRNVNFFTDSKEVAKTYTGNDGIYEGYINITNPITIDANGEVWSKIDVDNIVIDGINDVRDFLNTYGASTWKEEGKLRTSTADLVSAIEEAVDEGEIVSDGVIIKNIYDEGMYGDGTVGQKLGNDYITFNRNQFKNVDNTSPTTNSDIRYSLPTKEWQQHLEENYKPTGTRTNLKDINLPTQETSQEASINLPQKTSNIQSQEKIMSQNIIKNKKTLNPTEISNLTLEDVDTTPTLPTKNYGKGNKQSSFFSNIVTDAKFLENDLRQEIGKDENIRYYKGISNQETLEKAYKSLNEEGKNATLNWFNKDSKDISAEDVAKGWILLKQYQDSGDYQSAVEVAKKMRDMGTKAGQAVQAYNILSRLTPEGMFYYAQSELNEAYNKMVQGKSQKWIEENQSKFDLTPEETQFIMDNMNKVAEMEDGYDKKVKIAEIQKIISDKIPSTMGQSIKSWMRISMLFNPKTQVRNIAGNAVILPVNISSDIISSGIDKAISKKTGVRTTGNVNLKNYGKGFGKGLYESYNDFRKGINTRNIEGNRFEVNEGKNFKDKGIGKALNRVDNILSFALDAGDRGFYEATFTNSINNQLTLNNTTEVTQDMIDIATNEALQRTWQDNNKYTEAVLKIRKILNSANIKGYGLGDVLIPFAKTPANLTKAIIDYSPAGLVKSITLDARTFKNSLENGQFTPQMQHKFVQNLGKGMAGSFLYVLGYALAKAGIASGEADDDKDVKNFMKNSLGISSYSLKIGNKTFTYDWAQPVATPLAIMTNYVKYSKDNPDANILEKGIKSLNIGTEQLLQQSFMESLNTVLNGNGTTLENLSQAVLELPARAIPTFSKQIADMVDGTQRTSFEYGQPVKSAVNSVVAKIPVASKSLPVSRDTLGNEIKKYGGENNIWNVMFNPANVNKGELSKAGEEIYRLYQETGETTVFPITAPYYINSNGEQITMTSEERSNYQKVTGKYTEKAIEELLSNTAYKELSNDKKAELVTDIISDSNAKAKYDILDVETEDAKKKRELIEKVGTKNYYDYRLKTKDIEGQNASLRKNEVLLNANYSASAKEVLYVNTTGKEDKIYNILKDIDIDEYLDYKIKESKEEFSADKDSNGNSISGTSKKKYYNYINSNISDVGSRLIILGSKYKLSNSERHQLSDYINQISSNNEEAIQTFEYLSKNYVVKGGKVYYK